jgi:hypothetical protein
MGRKKRKKMLKLNLTILESSRKGEEKVTIRFIRETCETLFISRTKLY